MNSLEQTVPLMLSGDYRGRFLAEYWQLRIRTDRLESMLGKLANGELEFEPDCPEELLHLQLAEMVGYLARMEERAEAEGIDLDGAR